MKGQGLGRVAGVALAAGAFAGTWLAPRSVHEGSRSVALADPGPLQGPVAGGEAVPAGFLSRLERDLGDRMPDLDAATCRTLARTVVAEAASARIDPLLVLALIDVESSFDPAARSHRGAKGLMQLREATMKRERERAGLPPADPHDPIANVQSGVRYLRRLLDAFGREELALMAYNAGPNRIRGYLREGEIPPRFRTYPRRVHSELRHLRDSLGIGPAVAQASLTVPTDAAP